MNIKQYIYDHITNKAPNILEAGTAEGNDTVEFSKIFPNGNIYAFEPVVSFYKQAYDKVRNISNVKLFNNALAEVRGQKTMFLADRFGTPWGSASLLPPKDHLKTNPDISFRDSTVVDTVTLQDILDKFQLSSIDIMWLDMQGYEPVILMNNVDIIKKTKYIYSEINLVENYQDNVLYPEFAKFMEDSGFKIVYEEKLTSPTNIVDGGNVLFENTNVSL